MQIVQPKVEYWGECPTDFELALEFIENAGRVCYKSYDKKDENSALPFVRKAIVRGHMSVLRFGTLTGSIKIAPELLHDYLNKVFNIRRYLNFMYYPNTGVLYVSGNWQAWWEWGQKNSTVPILKKNTEKHEVENIIQCVFGDPENHLFPRGMKKVDDTSEVPLHCRAFAGKFLTDRAVSHELVRHTTLSFLQESQRYCDSKNLKCVPPYFSDELSPEGEVKLRQHLHSVERLYNDLIEGGLAKEKARYILPNATATEVAMSGFYTPLRHLMQERALNPGAYPPIREVTREFACLMLRDSGIDLLN